MTKMWLRFEAVQTDISGDDHWQFCNFARVSGHRQGKGLDIAWVQLVSSCCAAKPEYVHSVQTVLHIH